MLIGEFYGTRATDKKLNHAAGDRNVSPAARFSSAGNSYVSPDAQKAKPRGPKAHKVIVDEPAVTAEDLFG
jgi:hypothetical protein